MKAIAIPRYGGPEAMSLSEVETPKPGDGEVLVRLEYAGVNFIDVYMRKGIYGRSKTYGQKLPMTLGMEGGGTVAETGPGVDGFAPGERVAYCISPGSYAEYASVPAWRLVKVPDGIDMKVATTLMLQGCTAHYLSHSLFPLKPGHTCLVYAGAGGVGRLLIQLARLRGARVIATAGSPEKAAVARELGADPVILYRDEDVREAVRAATDEAGVDVVYDSVGRAMFEQSLGSLKRRGTFVLFGASSGTVDSVDPLDLAEAGSVFFTRPHLADYMASAEEIRGRAADLFDAVSAGQLDVAIDREYPLAEAAKAHTALENRETAGKVLLRVGS